MPQITPTKGNLMSSQRSLSLATLGYDLMDRKRNLLIREMMALIDIAKGIQSQIDSVFQDAYQALQAANITLGSVADIAHSVPEDTTLQIRYRSVMGVELPKVSNSSAMHGLPYGFQNTNSQLDTALWKFQKVKELTTQLAEVEISVYRLAYAIRKTQKRANALKNIIIPKFSSTIKYITDALEEKDREEFARLKIIKRKKNS